MIWSPSQFNPHVPPQQSPVSQEDWAAEDAFVETLGAEINFLYLIELHDGQTMSLMIS